MESLVLSKVVCSARRHAECGSLLGFFERDHFGSVQALYHRTDELALPCQPTSFRYPTTSDHCLQVLTNLNALWGLASSLVDMRRIPPADPWNSFGVSKRWIIAGRSLLFATEGLLLQVVLL